MLITILNLTYVSSLLNTDPGSIAGDGPYSHWTAVLSAWRMAHKVPGCIYLLGRAALDVPVVRYGAQFEWHYGIYILILDIIMSLVMLIVVVKLRLASRLGPDFINSTLLPLDPLKKLEVCNASLKTTVDALADPYMFVQEYSEFL